MNDNTYLTADKNSHWCKDKYNILLVSIKLYLVTIPCIITLGSYPVILAAHFSGSGPIKV